MNNIVIGCYENYDSVNTLKGGLFIFVESLRKFNNSCIVVIACEKSKIYSELIDTCKTFNVELFDYDNSTLNIENVQYQRNIVFFEILKKYNNINKVLLSDCDDVLFQDDPFNILFDTNFYCALEISKLDDITNGSSIINRNWIKPCYNNMNDDEFNNKFKNKYVICCGTILGLYKSMIDYLDWFYKNQKYNDQGAFNIYIYEISNSKTLDQYFESKILTLDRIDFSSIKKNKDGYLINNNNHKYSIIHQINRCGHEKLIEIRNNILYPINILIVEKFNEQLLKFNLNKNNIINKINYIDHIVWINLSTSKERRNYMTQLLSNLYVNNTRIDAIYGKYSNVYNYCNDYYYEMSKYEIACTLSHIKAINKLKNMNGNYFLVLEDDISFDNIIYFNKSLINIIKEAPKFDILTLSKTTSVEHNITKLYTDWNTHTHFIGGAIAYIISKEGVNKFCDFASYDETCDKFDIKNKLFVSDQFIYKHLKTYIYQFNFITSSNINSVIHPDHMYIHYVGSNYGLTQILENRDLI